MDQWKGYSKHIACLESYWNEDVENRLSVIPILDLLGKTNGTKSFVLTCNTPQELEFNLDLAKEMRGYRILYLAFHGYPGGIWLADVKIGIDYLGELMGRR